MLNNFNSLLNNLKEITGYNYPKSLTKVKFLRYEFLEGNNTESCLCGKTNLKHINIFKYPKTGKEFIIGSQCINHFNTFNRQFRDNIKNINTLHDILENDDIKLINKAEKKLNKINNKIKDNINKVKNNECLICKKFNIKKDYNYKNEFNKIICKKCLKRNNKIYCINKDCYRLIKVEKSFNNDIKRLCKACWCKSKGYF